MLAPHRRELEGGAPLLLGLLGASRLDQDCLWGKASALPNPPLPSESLAEKETKRQADNAQCPQ